MNYLDKKDSLEGGRSVTIGGRTYMIKEISKEEKTIPRKFSQGGKLVCDTLKKLTNPNATCDYTMPFATNSQTHQNVTVDAWDSSNRIAVNYIPEENLIFDAKTDKMEDFYARVRRDFYDSIELEKQGVTLFNVPFTVANCEIIDGRNVCNKDIPASIKEKRVEKYLSESVKQFFGSEIR